MGMKILLSIDNSLHSHYAIEEVARDYWPSGSEVLVATAVWAPFGFIAPAAPPEAAEKIVAEAADRVRTNPFVTNVETKVVMGNPKTHITKLATEWKAQMLVAGSRKPALAKLLFGSTSHALVLSSPCSVRICREQKSHTSPIVLVAFDGSEFAQNALQSVFDRQWPEGTKFMILNAVPTVQDSAYDNPHVFSDEELAKGRAKLLQVADKELAAAATLAREKLPQAQIDFKVIDGNPRDALINAAAAYDADLIVVGTQGRNFSAQLAIGSVSEAVAVGAPCSVEIVKMVTQS